MSYTTLEKIKTMSKNESDFSVFTIEDFENEEFCETYISYHGGEVVDPEEHERHFHDVYSLVWPWGCMSGTPTCWGKYRANLWACIFILYWKYQKIEVSEADTKAIWFVANKYKLEKGN